MQLNSLGRLQDAGGNAVDALGQLLDHADHGRFFLFRNRGLGGGGGVLDRLLADAVAGVKKFVREDERGQNHQVRVVVSGARARDHLQALVDESGEVDDAAFLSCVAADVV